MGRASVAVLATVLTLLIAPPAGAVTITEYPANPNPVLSFAVYITAGPEGNIWWADDGAVPGIGRMTTNGELFPLIKDSHSPIDLVVAPSGWASWVGEGGFGTRSPSGEVSLSKNPPEFQFYSIALTPGNEVRYGEASSLKSQTYVCGAAGDHLGAPLSGCTLVHTWSRITGLAATSSGVVWASYYEENAVRASGPSLSTIQKTVELPVSSGPTGIAIGPEGNAWVAMWIAGAIDRIALDGTRTRFLLPAGSKPEDIVLGPDGAFWITESGTGKIARMTTDGVVTNEYPVPSGDTGQIGITVGPDGNIWFTNPEAGKIGKLVPDPLPQPPAPQPGPSPDTVAPRFQGSPAFSPRRFKVAGKARGRVKGAGAVKEGTTLRFGLSETATVTATIARKAAGRKQGKKCVAPGKAKPGAQRCWRYLTKGAPKFAGASGSNSVRFSGRVKGKALAPGSYRATLVARDGAGNASAPKVATFSIVR